MNITMRHLQGEEMLETLYNLNSYSLHPSPPLQSKEEWMGVVRERQGMNCFAVCEDDIPISVAVSTPMTQNMRGKLFPANGVWGVSTLPSARHKGYCRQAMRSLLKADRESGKAFTNLYPFRESFYERLGYVAYPLMKIARLETQSLSPLLKMGLEGEVKLQYVGEAYDGYREYLAEMRLSQHGMALFDHGDRGRANQNLFWVATAEFAGVVEGLMMYRILGEEVTKYNFMAGRFYYRTSRARYLLLNWIARHIDQADRAELWLAPYEYPDTWLSDMQVKLEASIRPAMSRVLDIEKISEMTTGQGSFSAKIIDPLCPWNEGAWRFESDQGKLRVQKSSTIDCELTIQGLTALIGGIHDPQDIPLRGWGNSDAIVQAIQREMFPRMNPYMHEMF
ncbi:MAG: GNAT family N-acetyltransferase [Anaerolineales bacterium]